MFISLYAYTFHCKFTKELIMNEQTFAELVASKLGILGNYQKIYRHIAKELAVQYGYDEDLDNQDAWGVEHLTLSIVKDGIINLEIGGYFEDFQINFLKNHIKNLSISVTKQGNSNKQNWEFYFPLNLQNEENTFIVSCFYIYDVYINHIYDIGSTVASEAHTAEEVNAMKLFFTLKG